MTAPNWTELTQFRPASSPSVAAKEILPFFRQNTAVEVKAGAVWDPVTEATGPASGSCAR